VAGRAARRALLHDASALPRDGPRAAGIVRRVAADGHHSNRHYDGTYVRPSCTDSQQFTITLHLPIHTDQVEATKESAEPPESRDVLLGGLLSPDIDQNSSLSRYQSSLYRKPSPYLVSRLRRYEALHRKCGPGTLAYNRSLAQLAASAHSLGVVECSYLVWTPSAGRNNLGDSMLSMASAFLYALLTGRVLLAHVADDMAGLFCEPFPGASWELPRVGFPLRNLMGLRRGSERSYGNMAAARTAANDNDNEPAAVGRSEYNKSLLPP
jgi:xyloglucan fucosyltransferase